MLLKYIHQLSEFLTRKGRQRTILDREEKSVYLERYYLLWGSNQGDYTRPKWCPVNVMLHHLCRSDEDELHDHPWWNCSLILAGGYWETTPKGRFWRPPGTILFRRAISQHRLEIDPAKGEVWTLFAIGPRIRDWGFIASGRWVQWQQHLTQK